MDLISTTFLYLTEVRFRGGKANVTKIIVLSLKFCIRRCYSLCISFVCKFWIVEMRRGVLSTSSQYFINFRTQLLNRYTFKSRGPCVNWIVCIRLVFITLQCISTTVVKITLAFSMIP